MGAVFGWFATLVAMLGMVVALHHLGVAVAGDLVGAARSVEQFLNTPIVSL
ncbi:MAG TPA: hypothetical protein VMG99_06735 [Thermoplasmata archaeon]|nr:hypothetical protein [Thermoplasmata archaeon]